MNKKYLVIGGLFLAVAIVAFLISYEKPDWFSGKPDKSIILYYSVDCPHCQNVEKFLQENNVADKVSFQNKSLDNNSANILELRNKAVICGLGDNVGIPFLWDGASKRCLMGDEDVINFFKEKIK